jgi:hypothetical protein
MDEVMIVDSDRINSTIVKIKEPVKLSEAISDIKKILEIKQTLLWRADAGTCCGSLGNIATSLAREISLIEKALKALEKNNTSEAILILEEYKKSLDNR